MIINDNMLDVLKKGIVSLAVAKIFFYPGVGLVTAKVFGDTKIN